MLLPPSVFASRNLAPVLAQTLLKLCHRATPSASRRRLSDKSDWSSKTGTRTTNPRSTLIFKVQLKQSGTILASSKISSGYAQPHLCMRPLRFLCVGPPRQLRWAISAAAVGSHANCRHSWLRWRHRRERGRYDPGMTMDGRVCAKQSARPSSGRTTQQRWQKRIRDSKG